MESQIYPAELQLHKANTTSIEASFFTYISPKFRISVTIMILKLSVSNLRW